MMVIDNKLDFGQIVYLKTDKEQLPRIVTGIFLRNGLISYYLSQGEKESTHYDVEISETIDVLLKTTE